MATVPKFLLIPSGYKVDKIYSVLPTNGVGDFDFARTGLGSRVNGSGLIENVQTGIPRLNHSTINGVVGQCPSLLLEAQSQNLFTYSEDLTNAVWDKVSSFATPNLIIAPDGTLTADKLTEQTNYNAHYYRRADFQITNGVTYTGSVFLKKGERFRTVIKTFDGVNNFESAINLSTGIVENGNAKIFYNFNGWIGIEFTVTAAATTRTSFVFRVHLMRSEPGGTQYIGDGVSGFYTWGNQFEIGNRTSYIPTVASTETRLVESALNAGDINTFNSIQGVLFAEVAALKDGANSNNRYIALTDGTFNNLVYIRFDYQNNRFVVFINVSGNSSIVFQSSFSSIYNLNKIAVKWKTNDFALWINGTEVGTNLLGNSFSSNVLNKLSFSLNNSLNFSGSCNDLRVYDTVLTYTELQDLTTIR